MHKRGQIAVTDLFIALSIFIILMTVIALTWQLYTLRLSNRLDYDYMVLRAFQISDTLVKSQGYPTNWETIVNLNNPQEVTVIGLVDNYMSLSPDKVDKFSFMNYTEVQKKFKIGQYNYYFVLKDLQGAPIKSSGLPPAGKYTVNLARVLYYQDATQTKVPTVMEFALWK